MCGPIPIIMGVVTAGLGIGQAVAGAQAAQDQVAFANAQAQQQYAFQQNSAMVARGYEDLKANQQEEVKRITRLFADNAFANDVAGFNSRFIQEQAASSQEQQKGAIAGLKARGEVLASGRLGNTPDNLIADFYRQQAQYDFATSQNLAFMGTQLQQQKVGAATERGSRIASAQTYIKQPVLDPLEPLYQKAPSSTPFILQGISAGMSGVTTGMSTAAAMKGAGLDASKWNPFKK
jgi:hypothetical protein